MPELIKKQEEEILRYPRLDTVLMVEKVIQDHNGEYKKRGCGKIGWIYYPESVDERIRNKHLFWPSS